MQNTHLRQVYLETVQIKHSIVSELRLIVQEMLDVLHGIVINLFSHGIQEVDRSTLRNNKLRQYVVLSVNSRGIPILVQQIGRGLHNGQAPMMPVNRTLVKYPMTIQSSSPSS